MTHAYERALQDISARIVARRVALDNERQQLHARKTQVQRLLERMHGCASAFDDEDRAQVQVHLQRYDLELERLEETLRADEAKRREREEVFKLMLTAIQDRTAILEEDDECLSAHPEMLQFFARKQISLQKLLQGKMEELCGAI